MTLSGITQWGFGRAWRARPARFGFERTLRRRLDLLRKSPESRGTFLQTDGSDLAGHIASVDGVGSPDRAAGIGVRSLEPLLVPDLVHKVFPLRLQIRRHLQGTASPSGQRYAAFSQRARGLATFHNHHSAIRRLIRPRAKSQTRRMDVPILRRSNVSFRARKPDPSGNR